MRLTGAVVGWAGSTADAADLQQLTKPGAGLQRAARGFSRLPWATQRGPQSKGFGPCRSRCRVCSTTTDRHPPAPLWLHQVACGPPATQARQLVDQEGMIGRAPRFVEPHPALAKPCLEGCGSAGGRGGRHGSGEKGREEEVEKDGVEETLLRSLSEVSWMLGKADLERKRSQWAGQPRWPRPCPASGTGLTGKSACRAPCSSMHLPASSSCHQLHSQPFPALSAASGQRPSLLRQLGCFSRVQNTIEGSTHSRKD